jgi:hypothetical protein
MEMSASAVKNYADVLAFLRELVPVLNAQPQPKLGQWNWPIYADRAEQLLAVATELNTR